MLFYFNRYFVYIYLLYKYIHKLSSVHYTRNEYSLKNKLFRKLLALNEKKNLV